MRLRPTSFVDLETPYGLMRTHLFRPQAEGKFPGVILFSEIYQMTGPIARTAALLAGQGYIVAVPEVYHEFVELGAVFGYDKAGTDLGNQLKVTKELASYDADAQVTIEFLKADAGCNGRLAAMGICLGGHLAFRASMQKEVELGVCFYATDIHKRSLGRGQNDDSLARVQDIRGELLMIWGRQDPHVPVEGRRLIYDALTAAGTHFTWLEFNGEHAFMRDEGHRFDPALSHLLYGLVFQQLEHRLKS